SLYDYYTRHDATEPKQQAAPSVKNPDSALAQASPTQQPQNGPAVKTAAGRVFYGGGGITPDIDVKPMNFTPARNRIAEAAFHFTRHTAAGLVPGRESYKVEKIQYGKNPKPGEFVINERVVEAFRNFVRTDQASQLT